ncbi:DNA-directed RNA polymerase subunit alpha [Candidatus Uhrbacteria bacterium RIFCSPHIGHO2_02_FULL_47_44]|uniref:DNA-directed RNA polymerase subunit alpha n=1 Tax=Candidatus Uhrbacteria bacterium RIFCSPLOWO2_02_FULL_48_18 TaxID=1802408 RepID=A0A1F7VBV2_9BACT|nr:MAG: DNA-directed RNA polymerase subunit alpha [Candidatus Uhrbacteria bacterium RIFCSPHIGHO2_01_FULL_47_10]OGL70446.1 MAG: DNA-directed RNA polymerase subunit alpha [Candidatus Uhrbacteria bacterium RIFCSPHIGHO2_02_FULL_47_44]OGL76863.1 MAG: DNA-directed RNA polymerase subunit alpha [Candidatus Uhrbacteria bacterium RIFCSPHIGHO2_12_FULL_47_12]OGL82332.1 MAG: DNA-directed RNA polymerase subunit alpha [Candidatus Uhrbacteria bacterium RIFCSPLOWO2_01_FULL_47_17]OGL87979.1 MAG: DNA-directed RNA
MENILLPSKISFEKGERPNEGVLVVEPCFYGYGTTLGNALRRVLLSSLPGAAVTAVKMKGVTHEFQAIENVKEDALEIILNLKTLRLKVFSDEPVTLKLSASGLKTITAGDIAPNADVEIMNPELVIAHLTDAKSTFEMELTARKGRGYSTTEERAGEAHDLGTIAIDALFSPVRNVGYQVVNTRVGDITNYDKLIMNIETDGTITPEAAVEQSAKTLIDYFSILLNTQTETASDSDAS